MRRASASPPDVRHPPLPWVRAALSCGAVEFRGTRPLAGHLTAGPSLRLPFNACQCGQTLARATEGSRLSGRLVPLALAAVCGRGRRWGAPAEALHRKATWAGRGYASGGDTAGALLVTRAPLNGAVAQHIYADGFPSLTLHAPKCGRRDGVVPFCSLILLTQSDPSRYEPSQKGGVSSGRGGRLSDSRNRPNQASLTAGTLTRPSVSTWSMEFARLSRRCANRSVNNRRAERGTGRREGGDPLGGVPFARAARPPLCALVLVRAGAARAVCGRKSGVVRRGAETKMPGALWRAPGRGKEVHPCQSAFPLKRVP